MKHHPNTTPAHRLNTRAPRLLLAPISPCWTALAATALAAWPALSPAQTTRAVSTTTPAVKPAAPSAGLLNDWLRAQSPQWNAWDMGGEVRARYEMFDGGSPAAPANDFQLKGAADYNSFLLTREKVHVGYTAPWFKAYAEGRNSDASSDADPRNLGEDSFDLHQAYLTVGNAKEFPLTVKAGRQELIYGDERILGASDWSNTGRVFDAVKLRYEDKWLWVDAFAGRVNVPVDEKFNEADPHDWLFGLYASSTTLIPIQESQLYFLSRNVGQGSAAGTSPRDIYTPGLRVKSLPGKLKGWDYATEVVQQFGNIVQSGVRREQDAWAASVGGGFTWTDVFATPRLGLEYNFSTGDSNPNDNKSQTLDNLFPTNHKHYGTMDFVGWRNIHNPRLSLSAKPVKKLTVSLDYHLFFLADTHDSFYPQSGSGRSGKGYGKNSAYDSFVGSELDLEVNYAVTSWVGFRGGYGHFFPGSYVDQSKQGVGGSTGADWVYAQLTFRF